MYDFFKNKHPLISIIMPCYCCDKYVNKSVESIMNQKMPDKYKHYIKAANCHLLEVILINDGSTDNNKTLNCLKKLQKKYNNIQLINLENNVGQAQARNVGIKHARGTYINFVDADDMIKNNLFDFIFKTIKKYNFPDIICWGVNELYYDKNNNVIKNISILPVKKYCKTHIDVVRSAIDLEEKVLFGYLWNKVYKKEILINNSINIPNEHLIEDILFNIEIFRCAKSLYCIDKTFYNYARRQENNSVTSSYLPDYFDQYSKRINKLINWFIEENVYNNSTKTMLANFYIRYALSAVWRNGNKNSKMTKKDRIIWLDNFFEHPLTKNLLEYAHPKGSIAKINSFIFKTKLKKLILTEANFIKFISNNLEKILIFARQSR